MFLKNRLVLINMKDIPTLITTHLTFPVIMLMADVSSKRRLSEITTLHQISLSPNSSCISVVTYL